MTNSLLEKYYFEKSFGLAQEDPVQIDLKLSKSNSAFQFLCDSKLSKYCTPEEIVSRTKFIAVTDRINIRHPFLILCEFIEDFFQGEFSKDLIRKYHITDYTELKYITENMLNLRGNRTKKNIQDAMAQNLSNPTWSRIYRFVKDNSEYFREEQLMLLNNNILKAIILLYLLVSNGRVFKNDLINNIQYIVDELIHVLNILTNQNLLQSFKDYIAHNVSSKISKQISELHEDDIVWEYGDDRVLELNSDYRDIASSIVKILAQYPDGINYSNFCRKMQRINPIVKLVPRTGILEFILGDLENSLTVHRILSYWRYRPYSDILILTSQLEKKAERVKSELWNHGETAFFGRKIQPEEFLKELNLMQKGDFYDKDDQVTRIAGLFLSISSFLELRHEKIPQFDFSLRLLKNCEVISCLDDIMKREGQTFHVKIIIGDSIDFKLISKIRVAIPPREKALIITLDHIDPHIWKDLYRDNSIFIFGEKEIISIIRKCEKIPSRVNSICKIMYGDHRGKIVRLDAVDYESRIAVVNIVPDGTELSTGIGSLEEIPLGNTRLSDYENCARNYEQFLHILNQYSDAKAIMKGIVDPKLSHVKCTVDRADGSGVKTYKFEEKDLSFSSSGIVSAHVNDRVLWEIKTGEYASKLIYPSHEQLKYDPAYLNDASTRIRKIFQCSCMHWEGVTHSFSFCSHMIGALDTMAKYMNCLNDTWMRREGNIVTNLLHRFITLDNSSIIEALAINLPHSNLRKLISYINNLPFLDKDVSYSPELRANDRHEILDLNDERNLQPLFEQMEQAITRMKKTDVLEISKNLQLLLDEDSNYLKL